MSLASSPLVDVRRHLVLTKQIRSPARDRVLRLIRTVESACSTPSDPVRLPIILARACLRLADQLDTLRISRPAMSTAALARIISDRRMILRRCIRNQRLADTWDFRLPTTESLWLDLQSASSVLIPLSLIHIATSSCFYIPPAPSHLLRKRRSRRLLSFE